MAIYRYQFKVVPLNQNSSSGREARLMAKHRRMSFSLKTGKPMSGASSVFRKPTYLAAVRRYAMGKFVRLAEEHIGGPVVIRVDAKSQGARRSSVGFAAPNTKRGKK